MPKTISSLSIPRIDITNIIEIAIIAFIVYGILVWIKNTRAWVLLRGIISILGFTIIAVVFHFNTIIWLMTKIANIAFVAFIIIFQPELRKALEQLGRGNILNAIMPSQDKSSAKLDQKTIDEIMKASYILSGTKTGGLIVIERFESLAEYVKTGIEVDAVVSSQLLINIFEHNTPLHDGAIILHGNRVIAATCYLPLSENMHISKDLGTRHRAAIGVSEVTDSLTIVISEETGNISVASRGALRKINDSTELEVILTALTDEPGQTGWFSLWKGRNRDERENDK